MRIAYLDCFSGISGDMFLGALLAAGVPARLFEETVAALNVGATLEISSVLRNGIAATKVDVIINGAKDLPREVFHSHPSRHVHDHGDAHQRVATAEPRHRHPHRPLREIRNIISAAPISDIARQRALAMFEALAAAEAKIHNTSVEEIHLHEVGSADAIVDIVCAAVGSEALAVDEWACSPLNLGGGTVECAHGTLPVPAPATLELLNKRGAPLYSNGVQKELVTPTGAAIVNVLASRFGPLPAMKASGTGYGAGYRELPGQANVLRLVVGDTDDISALPATSTQTSSAAQETNLHSHTVTVLEANIDDLSPQVFGYLMDRALAAGALDVFTAPVQMKKSRPGLLLTVLCNPRDREALARLIFAETSTIGIRMRDEQRYCLARRHVTVATPWGDVRLKLASLDGAVTNYAPEYEDCRRIAEQHQIPLKTVINEAVRLYLERHHE